MRTVTLLDTMTRGVDLRDKPSMRQLRADSEATRSALLGALALISFGIGLGLAVTGHLDATGGVALMLVAPVVLGFAANVSARSALSMGTRHRGRARFAAGLSSAWLVLFGQ